jgi:hypothetical protein
MPFEFSSAQTIVLLWAIIAHFIADWLFQTEWMAINKMHLRKPAAWVHGSINAFFLLFVLHWYLALLVGLLHVLIDTRKPVEWWMHVVKGMKPGTHMYTIVYIWVDQVFHIVVLAAIVLIFY